MHPSRNWIDIARVIISAVIIYYAVMTMLAPGKEINL